MNCRKARKWISMDIDGELSVGRKEHLYNHIRRCGMCNTLRDRWLSLGDHLRTHAQAPSQSAEAAWADVRRAIHLQAEEPSKVKWSLWSSSWRWAAAALAVLALGFTAGLGVWRYIGRGSTLLARLPSASVEWVETGLPRASTMVYEDGKSGLTVIWVVEQNGGGNAGT